MGDAWLGALMLLLFGALIAVAQMRRAPRPATGGRAPVTRVAIDEPPNVVLIVIDTLRADALGAYGHRLHTSPELDAMARRGVRFARTVSQSSWTRPSFASMLTSLPPRASGIAAERRHVLPEALVTLPEVLDEAGYTTLGITANPNINSTFGFDQGFDRYVDSGVRFGWMREEASEGDALHGEVPLMTAPVVFEHALELVEAHAAGDRPTYLQIDLMDVHERNDRRVVAGAHRDAFPDHPDNRYLSAVRQVSAEIDAFVRTLESREGFRRKTLYVVTSDHGEGLRSHPHVARGRDHGYHVYESQTRVPLILHHSGGGLPPGRVVEEPVRLLDLMPTILDLAGVAGPEVMMGRSLRPLMDGEAVDMPDRRVVETRFRGVHAIGVYGREYAYIEHRRPWEGTDRRELQVLGEPQDGARTNRIDAHAALADELDAFLEAWEREHPTARPTRIGHAIPARELEQLRALGYIE